MQWPAFCTASAPLTQRVLCRKRAQSALSHHFQDLLVFDVVASTDSEHNGVRERLVLPHHCPPSGTRLRHHKRPSVWLWRAGRIVESRCNLTLGWGSKYRYGSLSGGSWLARTSRSMRAAGQMSSDSRPILSLAIAALNHRATRVMRVRVVAAARRTHVSCIAFWAMEPASPRTPINDVSVGAAACLAARAASRLDSALTCCFIRRCGPKFRIECADAVIVEGLPRS